MIDDRCYVRDGRFCFAATVIWKLIFVKKTIYCKKFLTYRLHACGPKRILLIVFKVMLTPSWLQDYVCIVCLFQVIVENNA